MQAATAFIAPIEGWFALLVEIQQLEAVGLVVVSIDDGGELRVELTRQGHQCLGQDPTWDESGPSPATRSQRSASSRPGPIRH